MEWIRPIFLIGEETEIFKVEDQLYPVPRESLQGGESTRRYLRHLIATIYTINELEPKTLKNLRKELVKASKEFFATLIKFVTKRPGWRDLHEAFKQVLLPVRVLRKAGYRLFIIESKEHSDSEITLFEDKKNLLEFIDNTKEQLKFENIKMKKDNDQEELNELLNRNSNKLIYQYDYEFKKRENYKFTEINKVKKDCLHRDFEIGIHVFLLYLYDKNKEQFPVQIDVHKLFRNIEYYKNNELEPFKFYIDQIKAVVYELKVLLYEMKMNTLSRVLIPCAANIKLVEKVKQLYDLHIIIENMMGDKLKYDQFLFMFHNIKFIHDSNIKEELTVYKDKVFMEDTLPKYIILQVMRKQVSIFEKMREKVKQREEFWDNNKYFQIEKMPLETTESQVVNAFEFNSYLKTLYNDDVQLIIDKLDEEKKMFDGRLWLFEGYLNPEDRQQWLEAIEVLRNINILVQDDIRDSILLSNQKIAIRKGERRNSSGKKLVNINTLVKDKPKVDNRKKRTQLRRTSTIDRSFDSDGEDTMAYKNKPVKLENLRPPLVWNFPIEKTKKNKEEEKVEIRQVDPKDYYRDGRVKIFLELLNKVKDKMLDYCNKPGIHKWKYLLERTIAIFNKQ
jgi:hypothetical protein